MANAESHVALFLLLLIVSRRCTSSSSDRDVDVCISQGGRFPRFSYEGQVPKKSSKGPDDLTFCRIYRKKTCCTGAQTHPALLSVRKLGSDGEGSEECLGFWEAMECAICHPRVGVRAGPPVLCSSFCDSVLKACKDAFFSFDTAKQVLTPCGHKDTICARGNEWATNGSEFCQLCGFSVQDTRHNSNGLELSDFCFDGKADKEALEAAKWKSSVKDSNDKSFKFSSLQRPWECLTQMDAGEKMFCAVVVLVLTVGTVLLRRRPQHRKAAILRALQEARLKQQASMTSSAIRPSRRSGRRG
eukprot:c25269_g1_i1 orf=827-1729(-)